MRLPVSEKTKKSLYEINDSWENLLGLKSMQQYRLLYCLQIIEEYLFDGDADLQKYFLLLVSFKNLVQRIKTKKDQDLNLEISNGNNCFLSDN